MLYLTLDLNALAIHYKLFPACIYNVFSYNQYLHLLFKYAFKEWSDLLTP